ncbi:ferredoxin-2, mitochondrial isoform X4 [Balaenoptera acutorostrata]|uniref:Ferredoxin-2, mitochondrial isoform X4 n=1 Tax=Balaenoptera acutorostrata TaxID=9767 RepID=A0ABM3T2D3_BALAC|nr:ferredoxin-2, mitochondrial isoform X4 [Balaenoptera acutorostrata]
MMPVMAASVAWGGVNAGFLLRAARGAWWCRSGGFWGSGEAAAPAIAKKFRATGSRPAGEEEAGCPERPGDVFHLVPVPIIQFVICTPICPQGERGVRRPVRPTDSATLAFLLFFKQPSSCLPQGLRICCSIRSVFPPDLLAPSHPSGPDGPVKPPWRAPPATCM